MGSGMSLVMSDIGDAIGLADPMAPGVVIGVAGILMAVANYPVYKSILASRRKKYADQIMRLSDEVMRGR